MVVTEKQLAGMLKRNPHIRVTDHGACHAKRPEVDQLTMEFPMELLTENRLRAMNPIARGQILKRQRADVASWWRAGNFGRVPLPATVLLVRIGQRTDAHDSLPACFKHVADEVACLLGVSNDDDGQIEWKYSQEPKSGRPQSVKIEVSRRGPA